MNDPEDLKQAYEDAMDEAMLLIAYLKTALVPFGECRIEEVPDKLFILSTGIMKADIPLRFQIYWRTGISPRK